LIITHLFLKTVPQRANCCHFTLQTQKPALRRRKRLTWAGKGTNSESQPHPTVPIDMENLRTLLGLQEETLESVTPEMHKAPNFAHNFREFSEMQCVSGLLVKKL
jgi:hypothetical protein